MLTFLQAKGILAQYNKRGGTSISAPSLNQFVYEVLQTMLWKGAYGNLRTFSFWACRGCITLPFEIETPEKIKLDGVVGTVFTKWFDFTSNYSDVGCVPAAAGMVEQSNYYSTVYDIPAGGARVGILGHCNEDETACVIVKGTDLTGREIFTKDNFGNQVAGEQLYIRNGELRYTQATFANITGIVKSKTKGYATLLWVDPIRDLKGFLADYSPLEEIPAYRRYRLTTPCAEGARVTVLARIRLKEAYTDNDLIPFESLNAIKLFGSAANLSTNRALDLSNAANAMGSSAVEEENSYKKPQVGSPMEVFYPLSGGAIQNIVEGRGFRGRGNGGNW